MEILEILEIYGLLHYTGAVVCGNIVLSREREENELETMQMHLNVILFVGLLDNFM